MRSRPAMAIDPNVVEIWSLYAAATIVIGLRVFCRSRMVGVSGFRPDDYLIFFAWVSSVSSRMGGNAERPRDYH